MVSEPLCADEGTAAKASAARTANSSVRASIVSICEPRDQSVSIVSGESEPRGERLGDVPPSQPLGQELGGEPRGLAAPVRRLGWGPGPLHHHCELPPRLGTGKVGGELGQRSTTDFLMDFRQFPRDGGRTLRPGDAGEVLQERDEPRGSLEENDWPFFAGGAGQEALPFAASARDEAQKEISVCAEPGNRKCRSDGRGAGNGDDRIARGAHRSDEVESGVAYDGRAGVGHKGDVPAVR